MFLVKHSLRGGAPGAGGAWLGSAGLAVAGPWCGRAERKLGLNFVVAVFGAKKFWMKFRGGGRGADSSQRHSKRTRFSFADLPI